MVQEEIGREASSLPPKSVYTAGKSGEEREQRALFPQYWVGYISSFVVFLCSSTEAIPKGYFPTKCIRESRWSAVFFRGSPREREKIEVALTKQIFLIFRSGFPQPCEFAFLKFSAISASLLTEPFPRTINPKVRRSELSLLSLLISLVRVYHLNYSHIWSAIIGLPLVKGSMLNPSLLCSSLKMEFEYQQVILQFLLLLYLYWVFSLFFLFFIVLRYTYQKKKLWCCE